MRKTIYIFLLLLLSNTVFSQSDNEVNTKVYDFVKQYEMYAGFSSDLGMSLDQNYKTEFSKLFSDPSNQVIVPSIEIGKRIDDKVFYSVQQYILNVQKRFPNGFDHKVEILGIQKPTFEGNSYWIDVEIVKYIFGLTSEKVMVREESDPLILKIYNSDVSHNTIKIDKIYDPRKYVDVSGWHMGVLLSPGLSSISTSGGVPDEGTWTESGNLSPLNGGIEIVKYGNKPYVNFGIRILSTTYSLETGLSGYTQNSISDVDADGDSYMYNFSVTNDLTEKLNARFIEVPVFYKYRYEFIQNTKLNHAYVNVGPTIAFNYGNNDTWEANGTTSGDYSSSLGIEDELFDIAPYGFYTDKPIELSGKAEIKPINVSAYIEAGLNFVISREKKLSCDVGVFFQKGLTSLAESGVDSYKMSPEPGTYNSTINSREDIKTTFIGLVINLKKQWK